MPLVLSDVVDRCQFLFNELVQIAKGEMPAGADPMDFSYINTAAGRFFAELERSCP